MVTYQLSSYGHNVLVSEGVAVIPVSRVVFIVITISLTLVLKFREALAYWAYRSIAGSASSRLVTGLFALYALNGVLHAVHYADSFARPVAYYEPKWLYRRYLIFTMELPFWISITITIIGYRAVTGLLMSATKGGEELRIRRKLGLMLCYAMGSMFTAVHYWHEQPTAFSAWVNVTIVGETVSAFVLLVMTARLLELNERQYFGRRLPSDVKNLMATAGGGEDGDDEEEIETFSRDKIDRTRRRSRSRSKTPTETTTQL